jgi:hypothetical protein
MALVEQVQEARVQVVQVVEQDLVQEVEQDLVQEVEQDLVQEEQVEQEEQAECESLHQIPFQVILQNDAKVSCILHSNLPHRLTKLAKHNLVRNNKLAVHI